MTEKIIQKNEIVKKTYNLLNVAPVTFVSDNVLKTTDKDYKQLKELYDKIAKTIEMIDFMRRKSIFDTSYFGENKSGSWYQDKYERENIIGDRIFGKITPELERNIDKYNEMVDSFADKNIKLPKNIYKIDYKLTKCKSKFSDFEYIEPSTNEYSDILNSRMYSTTASLMKLADIFGFIIMPLNIANETIYSCDPLRHSSIIKDAVNQYKKYNENKQLYVLCPLDFYDLLKHAKSEIYYQVYFPKSIPYIGMNIGMNLPVFRSIFETMGVLDQRVTQLEQNVEIIKKQLNSIENNIKILQSEVSKIAQQQVELRMQMIEQNKQFKKFKLEMQQQMARMIDPLLFSVNKRIENFDTSVPVELAFAWGAEFPEEFINMLGVNATNETKNIWLK